MKYQAFTLTTEILIQVLFKDKLKCHSDQNIYVSSTLVYVISIQFSDSMLNYLFYMFSILRLLCVAISSYFCVLMKAWTA